MLQAAWRPLSCDSGVLEVPLMCCQARQHLACGCLVHADAASCAARHEITTGATAAKEHPFLAAHKFMCRDSVDNKILQHALSSTADMLVALHDSGAARDCTCWTRQAALYSHI